MFRTAAVKIDWLSSRSSRLGADVMVVSFVAAHRSQFSQRALGAALQGTHIEVVYDRVKAAPPSMRPTLLAHVLVQEITHILQGISRHSQEGVMKANWTDADYRAMLRKPLPFTPEDIALIHMSQVKRAHNGRFVGTVSG